MKTMPLKALSAALLLAGLTATSCAQAQETILIGLAGPLTGPSARIGKDLEHGAQLAINDVNKQHPKLGGKEVVFKLQSEDDQSDPRTAVAVAQRLVDRNGADRHRAVTQDPLAGFMNVATGGEIHHRIRAPAG